MGSLQKISYYNEVIYRLNIHKKPTPYLLKRAFQEILLQPKLSLRDVQLSALLQCMMISNPSVTQITALLEVPLKIAKMDKAKAKLILPSHKKLIGVAGSGKKGFKLINVSTPASLLASSLGAYVSKTVSKATSSYLGSSDLLTLAGANLSITTEDMSKILMKIKFGAYSIENLVPEFDEAYGGKFFSPHVLSYGLAALLCPISFDAILYGFSHPNVQLSAQVLKSFGFSRGIVVTSSLDGIHYIDEFSVIGKSYYIDFGEKLKKDMIKMLDPLKDYNLPEYKIQQIEKEPSKQEQLRVVTKILMGKEIGPKAELICLNAGAILYLSELVENIEEGFSIAKKMLPKGEAFELLRKFIELTGGKQKI